MKLELELDLRKLNFDSAEPIGESRYDEKAFKNLEDLIDMTDRALSKIMEIARMKEYYQEYSIVECSDEADKFIKMYSEYINEYMWEREVENE